MWYRGDGVERDFGRARAWWERAFEAGEADAAYNLGILHRRGLGVPRSEVTAMQWWERAARAGSPLAQHGLGSAYLEGRGVTRDPVAAYAWFSLAARNGVAPAEQDKALLEQQLPPELLEEGRARAAGLAPPGD
jgi:TPR repeat protein